MERIRITHFSDVLCVWAYVSQVRVDELQSNFGEAIELDYRYFHVFGDVHKKMDAAWKDRGGLLAYGEHVREVVDKFGHVSRPVVIQLWMRSPRSEVVDVE